MNFCIDVALVVCAPESGAAAAVDVVPAPVKLAQPDIVSATQIAPASMVQRGRRWNCNTAWVTRMSNLNSIERKCKNTI